MSHILGNGGAGYGSHPRSLYMAVANNLDLPDSKANTFSDLSSHCLSRVTLALLVLN